MRRALALRLDPLLFGTFAVLLVLRSSQMVAGDADLVTHIRYGSSVLRDGLPRVEPLLWSPVPSGAPVLHEWLFEVIVAALDAAVGLGGPLLLGAGLAAGTLVAVRRLCARQSGLWTSLVVAMLTWSSLEVHLTTRPHLVTWLLLVVVHGWIRAWRGQQLDDRALAARLVPTFALWANLHGGFTLGLVILAVHVAAARITDGRVRASRGLLVLLACGAATLLNPWGPGLHAHILGFLGDDWITGGTLDFQPPSWGAGTLQPLLLWAVVLTGAFTATLRRLDPADAVLALLAVAAGAGSTRNIPLVGLLLAPALARHLELLLPRLGAVGRSIAASSQRLSEELDGPGGQLWWGVAVGAPVLLASLLGAPLQGPIVPRAGLERLAADRSLVGRRGVTEYAWGGFVLYEAPGLLPQVHPLNANYPPEVLRFTVGVLDAAPGTAQALASADVRWVLVEPERPLVALLQAEGCWERAVSDPSCVLLLRDPRCGAAEAADPP